MSTTPEPPGPSFQAPCEPMKAALARVSDAFLAVDSAWRLSYFNGPAATLLLQGPHPLRLGQDLWLACPQLRDSIFEREFRRARAGQCTTRFEAALPGLDTWLEVSAYADVDGLSVCLRDISPRRKAEATLRESEALFRAFTEHAQDVVAVIDSGGTILYESPAITPILGYTPQELIGRHAAEVVHPEDIGEIMRELARLSASPGGRTEVTYRCQHKDGSWRTLETKAWNQCHEAAVRGIVLNIRDVTHRCATERALRENEERFRALSASSPVGIFQSDNEGQIVYANPRVQQFWSATETEILGSGWTNRVHPEDLQALLHGWRAALAAQQEFEMDYRLLLPDATVRYIRGRSAPLRDGLGRVIGAVGTVWDITERKELEAELVRRAYHDALTSLENRSRFRERVEQALEGFEHHAHDPSRVPAVLFVDLDDFKTVNDSLGHDVGDRLLVHVAERLRHAIRDTDTVARLGGDEFAVLLQGVGSMEEAEGVAGRIVDLVGTPFLLDGHRVRVGASVGIALARPDDSPDDVLRNADLAMYRAKHGGKRRHERFAPEMHVAALDRLQLEDDLHQAVEAQAFVLHYQPIVELADERIVGAEALVRWCHPTRGMVPPGLFIPLAEETGLIIPLGRWVLREACRNAMHWPRSSGDPALLLSVNVSARQLQDPAFVGHVREALCESGLPPASLMLEITESVLMHDRDLIPARLQELKALGVQIAVDDFGTGFSSLAYLQKFPVDVLKIDKSFVDTVAQEGRDAALTRMIVNLAESLGLRSIAEGIEQAEQRSQLRLLGCLLGQGYLFARPMRTDALNALLQDSHPAPAPRPAPSA